MKKDKHKSQNPLSQQNITYILIYICCKAILCDSLTFYDTSASFLFNNNHITMRGYKRSSFLPSMSTGKNRFGVIMHRTSRLNSYDSQTQMRGFLSCAEYDSSFPTKIERKSGYVLRSSVHRSMQRYGFSFLNSIISERNIHRRNSHLHLLYQRVKSVNDTKNKHFDESSNKKIDCHGLEKKMKSLESEIYYLNNATQFNLASPMQVANVVYGPKSGKKDGNLNSKTRSTTKEALQIFLHSYSSSGIFDSCNNTSLDRRNTQKKLLVQKIIEWRSLHNIQKRQCSTLAERRNNFNEKQRTNYDSKSQMHSSIASNSKDIPFNSESKLQLQVENLFSSTLSSNGSQIDIFWKQFLLQVDKPIAKAIIQQLNPNCPMGYDPNASPQISSLMTSFTLNEHKSNHNDGYARATVSGKKGTLLEYVRDQKRLFPDAIILTRVGEFYEAFGIDAIALMQCCGLNPMAGKARAGCPVKNIQATLDGLTSKGFRVAVYEEASDTDSINKGAGVNAGSKSRLKNRMLAQMISSASPTYFYDLVLEDRDLLSNDINVSPRCHIGVINTSAGYSLVEISLVEHSIRVSERLTSQAVACRLAAYPPADPLFYVPLVGERKSKSNFLFLPSKLESDGPKLRVRYISNNLSVMHKHSPDISDVEKAGKTILQALLNSLSNENIDTLNMSEDDFVLVGNDRSPQHRTFTQPLHVETATQLGLMSDPNIPSLLQFILPESAPPATRRFMRRWLLVPPAPHIADAMSSLIGELNKCHLCLPPLFVPPVGKFISLLRAGQASAYVYHELLACLDTTILIFQTFGQNNDEVKHDIISPLMKLLEYESGIAAEQIAILNRSFEAKNVIEKVINTKSSNSEHRYEGEIDCVSDKGNLIPRTFFERNEIHWRGKVKPEALRDAYDRVTYAANLLAEAIANDFWGIEEFSPNTLETVSTLKSPISHNIFDNRLACKSKPDWSTTTGAEQNRQDIEFFHPRDRNGKIQRNRYTTERVESALSDYLESCENACTEVKRALIDLSKKLCNTGHLPVLVQAAHLNLILSTAAHHSSKANAMGWHMMKTYDLNEQRDSGSNSTMNSAGFFKSLWPYWMTRSESITNSFDLNGLFLLTAPNMSGKSTLMRATAAAALLANCGFCSPVERGSKVRRFDSIFVRGASSDIPTEGLSAFGAEMGEIAALMRLCTSSSLVFVDELGRGTSPKDGTIIAGAVLEEMANKGMNGIFATHLHDILNLPLSQDAWDRIQCKRMAIQVKHEDQEHVSYQDEDFECTFKLENGVCTESLAMATAAKFGLPKNILRRAKELAVTALDVPSKAPDFLRSEECNEALYKKLDKCNDKKGYDEITKRSGLTSRKQLSLDDITHVAEGIINSKFDVVQIPPTWLPPSSLEGRSCVYVLEIKIQKQKIDIDDHNFQSSSQFYVGETDLLSQRLKQHRAKGKNWASLSAIVIPVKGGKSEARQLETLLIRKMAQEGFHMVSVADGRSMPTGYFKKP